MLRLPAKTQKQARGHETRNYNFECDWLIQTTTLNVIGLLNCPITNCPISGNITSLNQSQLMKF